MGTQAKKASNDKAAETNSNPLISNEKFRKLYTTMLQCRMLQERVQQLAKQGRLPAVPDILPGREAAAVGIGIDLLQEDTLVPTSRDCITSFVKGVPLKVLFAQIFAKASSPDKGHSAPGACGYAPLNVIAPDSDITSQLNIATGIALANKMKKNGKIVVAYSGIGATALSFWHQAMNFAALHDLAIIFVVENNLQSDQNITAKAHSYGFAGIPVDSNDVVAVHRVAQESLPRTRQGGGPTLIECRPYSLQEESTTKRTRNTPDEDPVGNMETYLTRKGLFTKEWKTEVVGNFRSQLDAAVEEAENAPFPEESDSLSDIYSFDIREHQQKIWLPKY